jgi:hypothetical protein
MALAKKGYLVFKGSVALILTYQRKFCPDIDLPTPEIGIGVQPLGSVGNFAFQKITSARF